MTRRDVTPHKAIKANVERPFPLGPISLVMTTLPKGPLQRSVRTTNYYHHIRIKRMPKFEGPSVYQELLGLSC
jgi:hypothetical protein